MRQISAKSTNARGRSIQVTLCGVFVTFTSDRIGTYHAELSVSDNGAGSPQTVALTGNVVDSLSGTVLDDTQTPPAPV